MTEAPTDIELCINGAPVRLARGTTVQHWVDAQGLGGRRVAVEKNGIIVPRGRWPREVLDAGDRLEVVVAVGGG